MIINSKLINEIFSLKKILIKKNDIIKLSEYEEQIPMYDIYSKTIYPINKQNIYDRLIYYHYRFITKEIYEWISYLYNKYKSNPDGKKYKYDLDIMKNYDINILIETSYKALYKYSSLLGLSVTICKKESFNPYIEHIKPYYSKLELFKLGQNMNIISNKHDVNDEYLINQDKYKNICKRISNNDVSFDEIKSHHTHIIQNNCISWVCFYSFIGSFLFNNFLRKINNIKIKPNIRNTSINTRGINIKEIQINPIFYKGLHKIVKCIENAPILINDYHLYRFIWDDSFLINLNEGDNFIDNGFISATRDPFYSPGISGHFGLILLKIKIPKNTKGVGLFIENFSLFPKEEEFLLPPYCKLKLLSKNENFKYYHTNNEFEKLINRKYEFELIDIDYKKFYKDYPLLDIKDIAFNYHNLNEINLNGIDRIDIIKKFIKLYSIKNNQITLEIKNNKYNFCYYWFDSTKESAYEKFYYNKLKDGIMFSLFDDNGYPYLNIELGDELVINYINKFYFYNNKIDNMKDYLDIIYEFGRIFFYKNSKIYNNFNNFSKIYNKENDIIIFHYMSHYDNSIYEYLKFNKKYLDDSFITYDVGYWFLDEYFSKKITDLNIASKYKKDITIKEFFIKIIEENFHYYSDLVLALDKNIIKKSYVIYNIYNRLLSENLTENFNPNFEYNNEILDSNYKLIFRQPIRRI